MHHDSLAPGTLAVMFCTLLFISHPGRCAAADHPWVAPARMDATENPVAKDDAALAAGKKVFLKECASCHGEGGKGDGPDAKDLSRMPAELIDPNVQKQSDGALFWKITEGRKPMPGFRKMLSETERWQVIRYLRQLKK